VARATRCGTPIGCSGTSNIAVEDGSFPWCTMACMRSFARWTVVIAIFCTVVFASAAPAFGHARPTSPAAAGRDGTSSGFKSQPAPEKPAYIGPGVAIAGSTFINALVPSPSIVAWRLPSGTATASSSALHASRVSPHLRSIPLLI